MSGVRRLRFIALTSASVGLGTSAHGRKQLELQFEDSSYLFYETIIRFPLLSGRGEEKFSHRGQTVPHPIEKGYIQPDRVESCLYWNNIDKGLFGNEQCKMNFFDP